MPAVTLVVCIHQQCDFLERLLRESRGCYDDLVVVHDGPDAGGMHSVVEAAGGRFFERPRAFQQEPHLPFAFAKAKNDWILHFDADEFPSNEMKQWLQEFRRAPEPSEHIAGYTCVWPLWNGGEIISKGWPAGRIFLFHKQRIRFFGMVEQAVVPDAVFQPQNLVLCHEPKRKSYGMRNVLLRNQAYRWREVIAQSLLGKPTDLPCWRWESETWPPEWEQVRRHPLQTAFRRLVMETFRGLRSQWRSDGRFYFEAALNGPIHHALLCLKFWQLRRQQLRETATAKNSAKN